MSNNLVKFCVALHFFPYLIQLVRPVRRLPQLSGEGFRTRKSHTDTGQRETECSEGVLTQNSFSGVSVFHGSRLSFTVLERDDLSVSTFTRSSAHIGLFIITQSKHKERVSCGPRSYP